ncbi:GHKL domain-containing protein [Massilioclostridium coli]|uniref:sensor histidine kinase n=1 Tax=Massilioclostridium coli TaxID=1870991 RepID=UPI0022E5AD5B|nr:GHKL domain-containing protein [Massilioclostridium coli]
MSTGLWIVIELITNAIESYIMLDFVIQYLGYKTKEKKWKYFKWLFWGMLFVEITFFTLPSKVEFFSVLASMTICFIFSLLCLQGEKWQKCFTSVFTVILDAATSVIAGGFCSIIFDSSWYTSTTERNVRRIFLLILSKVLYFYLSRLSVRFKFRTNTTVSWWVMLIINPLISVLLLYCVVLISHYSLQENLIYILISAFSILILNIVTYWIFIRSQKDNQKQIEYKISLEKEQTKKQFAEELKASNQQLHALRHDLKSYHTSLLSLLRNNHPEGAIKLLEENLDYIDQTRRFVFTDNILVDGVINNKMALLQDERIKTTFSVSSLKTIAESSLNEMDLCLILDNLLENILDYYKSNPKTDKKEVYFELFENSRSIRIIVKNSISGSVLKSNEKLFTTKKDKNLHGFGIPKVKKLVKKYNGIINIFEENGFFCVDLILYFKLK